MVNLELPRSWEGDILRLRRTPDGGGEFLRWCPRNKQWSPFDRGDKFLQCPVATLEELLLAGLTTEDLFS